MNDMNIDTVISMTNDEFLKFIVGLPMTELLGLKKLMEVSYTQAVQVKDGLIAAMKTEKVAEKLQALTKSVEEIYAVLFVLENKCSIAQTIIMKNEGGIVTKNGLDKD